MQQLAGLEHSKDVIMKLKEYKAEKEEWTRRDGEIKEDKKKKKV
jgi:hypothetical protein